MQDFIFPAFCVKLFNYKIYDFVEKAYSFCEYVSKWKQNHSTLN